MHLKIKSTLVLLALPLVMLSQNGNYWSKTSAKSIAQKDVIQYSSKAENPIYYNLDKASLATYLANAPDRFEASSSAVVLTIPNPGGGMDRFEIFATQTMAKELAQSLSSVKSYVGRNVANKTHTLRITLTPQGFYGMTVGSTYGQTLINPRVKNTNMYLVFSSKDVINKSNTFKCEVEDNESIFESKSVFNANKFINGGILRRYRLAMATTVEYSDYHWLAAGLTADDTDTAKKNAVQTAIIVKVDRLNQIYERDLAVTLQLIANNDLLISLGDTADDGYTNGNHSSSIDENQTITDAKVGAANYDVGHLLSTLDGGLALLPAVCGAGKARAVTGSSSPVGDLFIVSILAHEFGHQFGANHTQSSNVNENRATAVEPGSGSTIMGYAGVGAPNVQVESDAMFHFISISEISARFGYTNTGGCAEEVTIANAAPMLTAVPNYTIPVNTPFKLEVIATDANGDGLTYSWDQIDNEVVPNIPMPPASASTAGPSFRTFLPTTSPARYFPALSTLVTNSYATTWEVLPTVARTLNFGVIVRDNNTLGGQVSNETTTLTVNDAAGPFRVSSQRGSNIIWGTGATEIITWDVANTDDVAGVNSQNMDILLSTDGGLNFNTVLVSNTPNDGSQNITVPNSIYANARIMIRAADNVFFDINEAAIEITGTPPSCISAQNMLVDNVLDDAGVISWTGSQSNPSNGYDYIVNTTGTTPTAGATPTATLAQGATTVTPNGLAANTTYYFYIRANCGGGDLSDWSAAVPFKTTCTALTAPFVQDFNGTAWNSNGNISPCWRRTPDVPGSSFTWETREGASPHTPTGPTDDVTGGGKYIYTESLGSNNTFTYGDEAILSTPPIDLSALTFPRMKISYHMFGFSMGTMKVQVKEINAITYNTVFSISGQQQTTSTAPFIEQTIDLSAYAGQSVHIRFIGIRAGNWGSTGAFDQFIIEETTGCALPENLTVSNLTANSGDLSWGTIGNATDGYEWVVTPAGLAPDPATAIATGTVATGITTAQASGLAQYTDYDAYVRTNCGATGLSSWSLGVNFVIDYCAAAAANGTYESISNVTFNTINNNSTATAGYEDFTSIATPISRGQAYSFNASSAGISYNTDQVVVWIDFNQDLDFEDAGEQVLITSPDMSPWIGNITIPSTATLGKTIMRIRLHDSEIGPNSAPCGNSDYGQVEDYTVVISRTLISWTGTTNSDWDTSSNWNPAVVPTIANDVIIPSGLETYPTASSAVAVHKLTVNSGASLIVQSTFTGAVDYNRSLPTDNWYLISSPLAGETVLNFLNSNSLAVSTSSIGVNQRVGFAPYDNTQTVATSRWNYYTVGDYDGLNTDDTIDDMIAGQGFSTKLTTTSGTISFTGNINTEDITRTISTGAANAYNLVGNPYLSFINSDTFLTTNSINNTNIEGTIWVWNQLTSNYDAQNLNSTFKIAPAQGFFVKRISGSNIIFKETDQSHETADTFQKTSLNPEVKLLVSEGEYFKYTKIFYNDQATTGFDIGYDSELFAGVTETFNIYSHLLEGDTDKNYQIQSLPNQDFDTMIVPIGVNAVAGKEITFSSEALRLPNGINLFLEDKVHHIFTRLDEPNSEYRVMLSESLNGVGRFYLHTSSSTLGTTNIALSNISVYSSNKKVYFSGLSIGKTNVIIYDVLGKKVMEKNITETTKSISVENLMIGNIYVVTLLSEKGKVTRKILIE